MFDAIRTEKRLLIVDENLQTANLLTNLLKQRFVCDQADSDESALEKMRLKDYAVILYRIAQTDERVSKMIKRAKLISPLTPIIFISANNTANDAIKAFRAGAFDYLQKSAELEEIESAVVRAFEHYESNVLKDNYNLHLEQLVAEKTDEVNRTQGKIEIYHLTTLKALAQALELKDFESRGHSERVVTFSLRLGFELGLDKKTMRNLEFGAFLHDIGKIGIHDSILQKPTQLTKDEWDEMKLHPLHGKEIIRNIKFLEGAAKIVAQHHERWDGKGYPNKLRGEEIDIGARVFAVVDSFDAMISDRVYRLGRSYKKALEELQKNAGTQFDPVIIEAFMCIPKEDWEILLKRSLTEKQDVHSYQSVIEELFESHQQFELVH